MMKTKLLSTLIMAALVIPGVAMAEDAPPAAAAAAPPVLMPAISGPLAATIFDAGPLGNVYGTGVVSAFGQSQSHAVPGDHASQLDVSNAQIFLNKPEGVWQYFLQFGSYSVPDLGVAYLRASKTVQATYGPLPQGYVKYAPNDNFSILTGNLPTLIGAEYTFSFENMNIERGLLWNQENAVNRGVQVNYTMGALALSYSRNDGFYSKEYSWNWLSATYTVDSANTVAFIASGNSKPTSVNTFVTPGLQNNEKLYNLIYTHTAGPWTFEPYLQYTSVPALPEFGFGAPVSASTTGAALLMSYNFDSDSTPAGWRMAGCSLPVRLESISSSGSAASGAPNLIYGAGSKAWSITVTPTYQNKIYFVRGELSYVGTKGTTPGLVFGPNGNDTSQSRTLFEFGLLF